MKYRSRSKHGEDLADGRTVAPGEVIELDNKALKESHNDRLIREDVLIPLAEQKGSAKKASASSNNDEGSGDE